MMEMHVGNQSGISLRGIPEWQARAMGEKFAKSPARPGCWISRMMRSFTLRRFRYEWGAGFWWRTLWKAEGQGPPSCSARQIGSSRSAVRRASLSIRIANSFL